MLLSLMLHAGGLYKTPVQQATIDKHIDHICAYLGFVLKKTDATRDAVGLECYADPNTFVLFLGYLQVRSVCAHELPECMPEY